MFDISTLCTSTPGKIAEPISKTYKCEICKGKHEIGIIYEDMVWSTVRLRCARFAGVCQAGGGLLAEGPKFGLCWCHGG